MRVLQGDVTTYRNYEAINASRFLYSYTWSERDAGKNRGCQRETIPVMESFSPTKRFEDGILALRAHIFSVSWSIIEASGDGMGTDNTVSRMCSILARTCRDPQATE